MLDNYLFIINPISGYPSNPKTYQKTIEKIFGNSGASFNIRITKHIGEGKEIASEAAKANTAIIAVGGDGTINEIAGALVGSQAVLGVIPKGSGNGIARELGMPLSAEEACKSLLDSRLTEIDVGRLNGHYFVNIAGIGLDAQVGISFNQRQKRARGKIHYFYITLREFLRFSPPFIEITAGKNNIKAKPMIVALANSKQYGSNAIIAPGARMNDGILSIVVIEKMPLWKFFYYLPALFNGTIASCPYIQITTAASGVIKLPCPLPYHVDGECFKDSAILNFEVIPRALKVLTGPGSSL